VLELEAAVQRNPADAAAWFELGVKQQENEREQKALQALRQAAELNPAHLPTWLALAVSYTNESDRTETYAAIKEWVDRNDAYRAASSAYYAQAGPEPASLEARFERLIQCLINMARGNESDVIDADIQIALAVLLNANEVSEGVEVADQLLDIVFRIMRGHMIVFAQRWPYALM